MNDLNITLDMTYVRFVELFEPQKDNEGLFDSGVWICINNNEVRMRLAHYIEDFGYTGCSNPPRVQVILEPWIKSEITAAELAVDKAKEALHAARLALKTVKGTMF